MLIPKSNYCPTLDEWAEKQGIRYSYTTTPKPGDIVMFDFYGGHSRREHTGIVVGSNGNTVYTIEGNTSVTSNDNGGNVMRRTRSKSIITSFIRPRYNAQQTAAQLVKIAESQIGVKESPAGSNNVKYNTWYYGKPVSGDAWPWCCAFVSWCFAALAGEIEGITAPVVEDNKVNLTVNVLRPGSAGEQVKTVQRILYAMGYKGSNGKAVAVDGDYGENTAFAVKTFQKKRNLEADGIVGEKTWGVLIGE